MKVIENKYDGVQFPMEVSCEHCGSSLEIEEQDCVRWYDSESSKDVYEFTCPCCDKINHPSPEVLVCRDKFFSYMTFIFENRVGSVCFRKEHGEIKGLFYVREDMFKTATDVRKATIIEFRTYQRMKRALSELKNQVFL